MKNSTDSTEIVRGKIGNTVQSSAKKYWCFTLNNYSRQDIINICYSLKEEKYVFGEEIGEECKTPHLQGHVEFTKRKRLTALKKINPNIHWEATRNIDASIDYCQKDGIIYTNMKTYNAIEFPIMDRDWQVKILNLIKEKPDDRSIYWFWEENGNSGKTTFTKYLNIVHNAVLVPSKTNDAFHAISKVYETNKPLDLIVFDIPRSHTEFINYGAIEKIKDGCIISGKYEVDVL